MGFESQPCHLLARGPQANYVHNLLVSKFLIYKTQMLCYKAAMRIIMNSIKHLETVLAHGKCDINVY